MKNAQRTTAAVGSAALLALLFAGAGHASAAARPADGPEGPDRSAGTVFVQTDATGGNAVAVYDRDADGTLRPAGTYPTGGLGGALGGSVVDHLASQGALAYDRAHHLLYVVNAGSNTVSVFSVRGDRLTLRQTVASGGDFPVSIAYHRDLLYVLNARDGGAVQGFARTGGGLVAIPSWHRALGLDPSRTPEFTSTPGQVAFTPDGTHLVVTTKNNGDDIDVFGIGRRGDISAAPVVNADPGALPFAVSFDSGDHLAVVEPATGTVSSYTVHADGTIALVDRSATGQRGSCWLVTDGSTLFASNAGSATLSGFADDGSGTLRLLGQTPTDAGTVDAAVTRNGRYLYVETGATGTVDDYRVGADGSLAAIGSVTVPGAAGAEGIAAS
jgi:6-phosphogluconolactonase (cycloisomerase 2 family)